MTVKKIESRELSVFSRRRVPLAVDVKQMFTRVLRSMKYAEADKSIGNLTDTSATDTQGAHDADRR